MSPRRYGKRRRAELDALNEREELGQPNRETLECMAGCGQKFNSEATFAYHYKPRGKTQRAGNECLTGRALRRVGFSGGDGRPWRGPLWVEYWYLEQLELEGKKPLAGFRKEAW